MCFSAPAAAQTINVTGNFDINGPTTSGMVLTGDHGFALEPYGMRLIDNFGGVSNCNLSPNSCVPGATVSLRGGMSDFSANLEFEGHSYEAQCNDCRTLFQFQIVGSFVLPPLAPTATVTAPFSFSGTFAAESGSTRYSLTGSGTATITLHSPSIPNFPNSWHIDRIVGRFDSPLASPWLSVDIGAVGEPGDASSSADGTTWNLAGAGGDIWGDADAFRFAFPWPGGNEIVARVDSEDNTHPFAKAGVMLRPSLDAGAPDVILDVTPEGNVEFMGRADENGDTAYFGGTTTTFPVWLKLSQRQGITASISADGNSWQTIGVTPVTYAGRPIAGLAVTSHDASVVNHAVFSSVRVTTSTEPPLPGSWVHTDIGAVGQPGSALFSDGVFTIAGDGADIWDTSDAFHYVYQALNGDGEIVARVTGVQDTNTFAKAGVMMRSGTAPNAPDVILDVRPGGSIEFMSRPAFSAPTEFIAGGPSPGLPLWLRLVRTEGTVTGYVSPDGQAWALVGTVDMHNSGSGVLVGLAVTSHDTSVQNTSTFDNVSVTARQGVPAPWHSQDVGATGLSGSASFASGTFTIAGAGADIWGIADAFQFVYQPSNTDPEGISARIVSEQNTDPFAKAGVMLRNGLSESAAFVILDVKPDGSLEFMQRDVDGGSVSYLGGAVVGFGTWLRLERSGSIVTASYSHDGSTWTALGSTPVSMPQACEAGIAVVSHDPQHVNTAVVDSVGVGP